MATILPALLAIALSAGDDPGAIGNEPEPIVLRLEDRSTRQQYAPLEPSLFGADGKRLWDFELLKDGDALARRPIEGEKGDGPRIPLKVGPSPDGGGPAVVLEIDRPKDRPAIVKGEPFALTMRAVDPARLRSEYGPGVYEGSAWLRLIPRDSGTLKGIRYRLRARLLIPGRRTAAIAIEGAAAVGRRVRVVAAVEEVRAGPRSDPSDAPEAGRLRVELIPEGGEPLLLQAPWPAPAGTWDPRRVVAEGPNGDWAVPAPWLDEPILVGDAGSTTEVLIDKGPARSVIHRQSLRLPTLFAPGRLRAWLAGTEGAARGAVAEAPVASGILAGPPLAFLNERLSLRALVSRGPGGVANPPEKELKVRVAPPSGAPQVYTLLGDGKTTGYATYALPAKDQPRLLAPGLYRIGPATGDPALDRALGDETSVMVGLEKDDLALGRERVAFIGSMPIHWPLIVWLDSGRKDGERHRAVTRSALAVRAIRGPEEIRDLSLAFSQLVAPSRTPPHDDAKDGRLQFRGADPKAQGTWPLGRDWSALDLEVNLDPARPGAGAPPKGERARYARFLVEGTGADGETVGRIFHEPVPYKIAAQWDYYWEWAWLPGMLLLASVAVFFLMRRARGDRARPRRGATAPAPKARPSSRGASRSRDRFDREPSEPEPPKGRPDERPASAPPGKDRDVRPPSPPNRRRFD